MKIGNNIPNKSIDFRSYNKLNPKTKLPVSTSFYNDLATLKKSVQIIENSFPNGADILIYAGSNGEEAISVLSLLKNPEKYKIWSIDIFKEAIDYAKRGIYSVNRFHKDGFLVREKDLTEDEKQAKSCFEKCVDEIEEPNFKLNNLTDIPYLLRLDCAGFIINKFFKLKSFVTDRITFAEGDIRDLKTFKTDKPIGGIFFRNALYHLTNNDLRGVLGDGNKQDMEINRFQVLKDLTDSIGEKLPQNGIFVMGNHFQEHIYLADKYTPSDKRVPIGNNSLMLEPPHILALMQNGKFKPCYTQKIKSPDGKSLTVPLIWQKNCS